MSLLDGKYNGDQLLKMTKVDGLGHPACKPHYIQAILATIVLCKNPNDLAEQIGKIVDDIGNSASVGKALETMNRLASWGPELEGESDGLDALCYHLTGHHCTESIKTLQRVLHRFEVLSAAREQEIQEAQARCQQKVEQHS